MFQYQWTYELCPSAFILNNQKPQYLGNLMFLSSYDSGERKRERDLFCYMPQKMLTLINGSICAGNIVL
jgi:hypothetical protein